MSEFESHWVPHSFGLVLHQSKELRKLLLFNRFTSILFLLLEYIWFFINLFVFPVSFFCQHHNINIKIYYIFKFFLWQNMEFMFYIYIYIYSVIIILYLLDQCYVFRRKFLGVHVQLKKKKKKAVYAKTHKKTVVTHHWKNNALINHLLLMSIRKLLILKKWTQTELNVQKLHGLQAKLHVDVLYN